MSQITDMHWKIGFQIKCLFAFKILSVSLSGDQMFGEPNDHTQVFYISKGLSVGLRMCLMLAPGWEGLKGAWAP